MRLASALLFLTIAQAASAATTQPPPRTATFIPFHLRATRGDTARWITWLPSQPNP